MNTLTKSLSHVLFSTRYSYQFTAVQPVDLVEQECWICLRVYFTQEEDDADGGDPRPECLPIKLPCGHVVGQQCFEEYRKATNDVDQCLMCRQKLLPLAPRTKPAALLGRICRTRWFQWHDRRLPWTFFGIQGVEASSSEIRMYNGETLTWLDMLTIIGFVEASYIFMYITLPIYSVVTPLLLVCMAYERFGNAPQSYIATNDPALHHPYGMYSYSIWDRFPELRLLYDIASGHAVFNRSHHHSSNTVPAVVLVLVTIAWIRKTREAHFSNSWKRVMMFLVYERFVFAFLGNHIITTLGALDMAAYLTMATCIVLTANGRARRHVRKVR